MADRVRAAVPWFLVAASVLFAVLTVYVLFAGLLPARQRAMRLEEELRALYAQEAQLHNRLAQLEQRLAQREQQVHTLRAERDELARRLEALERQRTTPTVPGPPAPAR